MLAREAETGGTGDKLARLMDQDIEVSAGLRSFSASGSEEVKGQRKKE